MTQKVQNRQNASAIGSRKEAELLKAVVYRIGQVDILQEMQEIFHQLKTRRIRPVLPLCIFQHNHLMRSNLKLTRLLQILPDFAQEVEDNTVH